jgi:hypothetical protein
LSRIAPQAIRPPLSSLKATNVIAQAECLGSRMVPERCALGLRELCRPVPILVIPSEAEGSRSEPMSLYGDPSTSLGMTQVCRSVIVPLRMSGGSRELNHLGFRGHSRKPWVGRWQDTPPASRRWWISSRATQGSHPPACARNVRGRCAALHSHIPGAEKKWKDAVAGELRLHRHEAGGGQEQGLPRSSGKIRISGEIEFQCLDLICILLYAIGLQIVRSASPVRSTGRRVLCRQPDIL